MVDPEKWLSRTNPLSIVEKYPVPASVKFALFYLPLVIVVLLVTDDDAVGTIVEEAVEDHDLRVRRIILDGKSGYDARGREGFAGLVSAGNDKVAECFVFMANPALVKKGGRGLIGARSRIFSVPGNADIIANGWRLWSRTSAVRCCRTK